MKAWWCRLTPYAYPEWRGLLLIGIGTLALVGIKLLTPWPLKLIVDHVLVREPLPKALEWMTSLPGASSWPGLLSWLAVATILVFLARRVVTIAVEYVKAGVGSRLVYALAADVFQHLQQRSLIFHSRKRVGDLVKRVTDDSHCVRSLVVDLYLPIVTSLATLIGMFGIMWALSPTVALFAMGIAVPLGVVTRRLAGPMGERTYQEQQVRADLMALAEQTLTAIPIVQAFGCESRTDQEFRARADETLHANLHSLRAQESFRIATSFFTTAATVAVMIVGGWSCLDGSLSVGSLIVLMSYFTALYAPIESLAYIGAGFASAGAGARRVLEVLDEDDQCVQDAPHARDIPQSARPRGEITLQNVTFGYMPGTPVLADVSLVARPGEVTALVGPTGAGKSTLASLIARLYDPWEGCVRLDGVDLREITLRSLRRNVAVVLQDPFLLRLPVADNIAYGRPDATQEQIISAAKAAGAHGFVEALPDGYATVIGENGVTLSGGERQRLSIARALLQDAPVLILDEPTSALDSQTEQTVIDALQRLIRDRTTFIIAHRPSTVRQADRIIVLEAGRIASATSPDQLIEQADPDTWSYRFGHALQDTLATNASSVAAPAPGIE